MGQALFIASEFEAIGRDILQSNGFALAQLTPEGKDQGYDFTATMEGNAWGVEFKFYRTKRPQLNLIRAAATHLAQAIKTRGSVAEMPLRGMLILSVDLVPEHRLKLEEEFGIVVVDRADLFVWSVARPDLSERLSILLEEEGVSNEAPEGRQFSSLPASDNEPNEQPRLDLTGNELSKELRNLSSGKTAWKEYELLCERILKYLFPSDLRGWHPQLQTDDGLNRYDFVCRTRPSTEFWKFLTEDLHSRYVLFEFKNYNDKITQGQVLTTEKYLLERALRRVAIVFTREGAHDNATKMAQGAMREHGKLILILDDDKVLKLLNSKEAGEDPSDLLFEWADHFLLTLPR